MSYGILLPGSIAAKNIDAFNKSAQCATDLENGGVVSLGALSTTRGEAEVYTAATPVTASLTTAIYYLVNEPVIVTTAGKYRGLSDDPREFIISAGTTFGVSKPQVGDEIILSTDAIGGSKGSNGYIAPVNNTAKMSWAADTSGASLAYKLLSTTSISVGNERVVAYKFICVKA